MRRIVFVLIALTMNVLSAPAVDVAGRWIAEVTSPGLLEPAYAHVTLAQTGDTVSGTWSTNTIKGSLKGTDLKLDVTDNEGNQAGSMTGKLAGDAFTGSGT